MASNNQRLTAFAPIEAADARVLILGSMPSQESLKQQAYYAHPRNQFWKIVCHLLHGTCPVAYSERCAILVENGIALWDVLESCRREGSADTAIRDEVPNDFQSFIMGHPRLETVLCNGSKSYQLYNKYILGSRDGQGLPRQLQLMRLPSTSPAHAVAFEEKLEAWRAAFVVAGLIK
ncbi:DNA-deoxyinosine glycosylase [Acidaminobacter hydrogenoformans]|uniref:G/U mismatch-specific uracil-DNA glycosylase n=1 Tax=Acidaminobacter hydrogenoformans DSM 2784 TaxID=1120920 RepID=A0A1G5RQY0_9FIRM|nr:DNA-deoxyinosine glycosylase [Acidaminobacter hydrogenoformans]SCZ76485.1 G/U mismatch-specific uracil-DNA glycosylase [Acidaminobacter hydrogenoformans DSM 2784]